MLDSWARHGYTQDLGTSWDVEDCDPGSRAKGRGDREGGIEIPTDSKDVGTWSDGRTRAILQDDIGEWESSAWLAHARERLNGPMSLNLES